MSTIVSPTRFDAPTVDKRRGELLDVARVLDGGAWLEPTGLFSTFNCLRPSGVSWVCPPTGAKNFTSPTSWVDGVKFFVYLGATCKAIGYGQAEAETEIGRVFDLNESFAVEQQFRSAYLAGSPVVIAGTFSPANALALLEQDAAEKYAGVPTIHMSRAIASLLSGTSGYISIEPNGELRSRLGSKVVAGGGYPSTTMWATGETTVVRGDKHVDQVFNQTNNEVGTLAERAYIASGDCYRAQVGLTAAIAPGVFVNPNMPTPMLATGTDQVSGPSGTWSAPGAGLLRNVTIVVTSGSVTVDGDEVSAPNTINFDADSGEALTPPQIQADGNSDRAVVSWVTAP